MRPRNSILGSHATNTHSDGLTTPHHTHYRCGSSHALSQRFVTRTFVRSHVEVQSEGACKKANGHMAARRHMTARAHMAHARQ